MLILDAVSKIYDGKIAVKNVSLAVGRGEIYGLLGPNGAGKTSIIRMICGITFPDSGTIEFLGKPMGLELQAQIGYLPEERGLYRKMKVGELLVYFAELKGMRRAEAKARATAWLKRFEIDPWSEKKVEELSKGMQQKVQFIAAVLHDPELLILDEPFSGLDPLNSELVMDVLLDLKRAGKTILFSTHRMEQVEKICDSICLINNGEKILDGNVREVKKSYGKNRLHVEFDGSDAFIDVAVAMGKVEVRDRQPKYAELKLLGNTKPKDILALIGDETDLTRFELAEPSLREIFMLRVGETSQGAKLSATA